MQTPDDVVVQNGHLVVTGWLKVVVNPSWLYRLPHMLTAAWLTGSFLVAGIGAWYLVDQVDLKMCPRVGFRTGRRPGEKSRTLAIRRMLKTSGPDADLNDANYDRASGGGNMRGEIQRDQTPGVRADSS
jgi:Cytochrome bd terminal oxidase subunit I